MKNRKKVIDLKTKKIYNTVTDAAKALGIAQSTLSNILKGRRQTKLHYKYLHDNSKYMNGKSFKEIEYEILKEAVNFYGSKTLAAKELKIGRTTINRKLKRIMYER